MPGFYQKHPGPTDPGGATPNAARGLGLWPCLDGVELTLECQGLSQRSILVFVLATSPWPAWAQRIVTIPATPVAPAACGVPTPGLRAPLPPRVLPSFPAALPSPRPVTGIAIRPLAPMRSALAMRLGPLFDGSRAALPADEPPAMGFFLGRRTDPGAAAELGLIERYRPWRTRAQLAALPPRPAGERFSFQLIGDAEPGRFFFARWLFGAPGVFERQLKAAQARGGDFVLQLGDMVSRGLPRYFSALLDLLERVGATRPFITALGNHDRRRPHGVSDSRLYQSLFGPPSYYFDHGGVRFVVVDSSAGRMNRPQLNWLDRVLDTKRTKIVFTHMPPIQLSEWTHGVGGFKDGSRQFADIVARRNVARVYVGHVHGLGTLSHQGVRYVLSGGGGSPLFPWTVKQRLHHTLTVEVGEDGVRETVHPLRAPPFPL